MARHILRHTVTADRETTFEALKFHEHERVCAFFPISRPGATLSARRTRAGIVFCESATHDNMLHLYQRFLRREVYQVSDTIDARRLG